MKPEVRHRYQLGLIGYPVERSLSPILHARALKDCGLSGEYRLYPSPPDLNGQKMMGDLIRRMRAGEIQGLNVTIPHKLAVIPMLDDLTPAARSIGAVNTIYLEDGVIRGDNTDAAGFIRDLERHFTSGLRFVEARAPAALVLGAGGAGRAVTFALAQAGWKIILAARRKEQARQLANDFGRSIEFILPMPFNARHLEEILENYPLDLVVNTTPVGMYPEVLASPWPEGVLFPEKVMIYDLIYKPAETPLVRLARAQGLATVNGLGMLVEQAALAFETWTGFSPDRESMASAVGDLTP